MSKKIAYLGPEGTYTEIACLGYLNYLSKSEAWVLSPYATITQALGAVVNQAAALAIVPVENSIQGSVTLTLDTLWHLDQLRIQQALVLPITHSLLSKSPALENIEKVYSHPQALAQCQGWIEKNLPQALEIATNSTTEALEHLHKQTTAAAIASPRASQLYNLPMLACNINDYPDNSTRFWVLGLTPSDQGSHLSLAFSVPANVPGSLVKPLQVLAKNNINLSRIESRPTKRLLGEYLFYLDLEANAQDEKVKSAIEELSSYTARLKIFGNYHILPIGIN